MTRPRRARHKPTHAIPSPSRRLRKIKKLPGDLVLAMAVNRLAHPITVKGQMAFKWGYRRSALTKYTLAAIDWLVDRYVPCPWKNRSSHQRCLHLTLSALTTHTQVGPPSHPRRCARGPVGPRVRRVWGCTKGSPCTFFTRAFP